MAQCDMCGKSVERLILGVIEGVDLNVCSDCLKLGKNKETPRDPTKFMRKPRFSRSDEPEQRVLTNSGQIIKQSREKRGMRQQDLAKMLQIKDSFLHHIEIGDMELRLGLAKKLEDALGITLITKVKSIEVDQRESSSTGMTLGDILKIKK